MQARKTREDLWLRAPFGALAADQNVAGALVDPLRAPGTAGVTMPYQLSAALFGRRRDGVWAHWKTLLSLIFSVLFSSLDLVFLR